MTRLAILAGAVLTAALVAIAALRRRVPTYPDAAAYQAELERDGEALEPDLYLIALLAAGQDRD